MYWVAGQRQATITIVLRCIYSPEIHKEEKAPFTDPKQNFELLSPIDSPPPTLRFELCIKF